MREFLRTKAGTAAAWIFTLALLGLAGFMIWNFAGSSDGAALLRDRVFICSETGKPFPHSLTVGEEIPVMSPFSGKRTGFPAEKCYWTKDGKTKSEPTAVLLNAYVGKSGPTYCPDCGRLVVPRNPMPSPGVKPPPTKAEASSDSVP
ncbi:MAG: hypothetical protein QM770_04380 [Tepidisphaeraceae bacterium]